jgi:hypothetical protein
MLPVTAAASANSLQASRALGRSSGANCCEISSNTIGGKLFAGDIAAIKAWLIASGIGVELQ